MRNNHLKGSVKMQDKNRDNTQKEKGCECPYCEEPLCPEPGESSVSCKVELNVCPECKTVLEKKALKCSKCGKEIKK